MPDEPCSGGGGLFVSLTRVNSADQPVENATIVAEEMHGWLRDIDGFEGFLMLTRPGTTLGLAFWESRDVAERNRVLRMQFIERMTSVAGVEIEEILDYDVAFANIGSLTIDSDR
jgi:hypothetical protein